MSRRSESRKAGGFGSDSRLDYVVASAPDHAAFKTAIERARARYVPALVLAEVDYFLRDERAAMRALAPDLARGAFTYAPASLPLLERAMQIDVEQADLGLGLVDSSIVCARGKPWRDPHRYPRWW